ncbi:MFS transporter [Agrobacterium rubi]|uniref:MFS transporter n=2 Tax=Agrobacterium rubi TaxID=28099 RepID=A0AAE7UP09_9HYPH|nr:MFS transporter [Agrobacterium rubi]NTF02990.1 MFS transporter [Agrobacterium rubi]NTF37234.1 MFS transporter [Agrobacterium rubi]OCJ55196.1 MFS transporter [Agrobacterium rubi]QTG01538.1 MFS transporter [Agrobacterium rubi]
MVLFASSFGQTFFISLSGGEIRRAFGLSDGDFGLIYMGVTLASAISLVWLGKLADRWSFRQVVSLAVPALALGALGMAYAFSTVVLVASLYLLRLFGQGMMVHIGYTSLGRWFAAERGRAVSLSALGLNVGQAVLPLLAVAGIAAFGWRSIWMIAAIFLVAIVLPAVLLLVKTERVPTRMSAISVSVDARSWTRPDVVRDPFFFLLMLGMLPPAFISNTIFFHQVHLAQSKGWPVELMASAFFLYAGVAVANSLLSGYLVDRFSALRLLPFYLIPFGVGCVVLAMVDAPWAVFAFMVLYGISDGFSLTLFGSLWPEVYGVKFLGAIRAVIVAIMVFASALGPGLGGLLIDHDVAFTSQIFAMGAYCILIVMVLLPVSRHLTVRR